MPDEGPFRAATGYADQLELRRPFTGLEPALARFFAHLRESGEERRFHPHPFSPEAARERCSYDGRDVYCVAFVGDLVLGYGMLRGWDEGYAIPSLGIAVHADARGMGLGRALMLYLHAEASRRGARRIRLKVYPDNAAAVSLYRSLGYRFEDQLEDGQLVGYAQLGRSDRGRPEER
jgi:ribosomal-protein-alanine N-acetyltransferase